jgi:hypothetical protein
MGLERFLTGLLREVITDLLSLWILLSFLAGLFVRMRGRQKPDPVHVFIRRPAKDVPVSKKRRPRPDHDPHLR